MSDSGRWCLQSREENLCLESARDTSAAHGCFFCWLTLTFYCMGPFCCCFSELWDSQWAEDGHCPAKCIRECQAGHVRAAEEAAPCPFPSAADGTNSFWRRCGQSSLTGRAGTRTSRGDSLFSICTWRWLLGIPQRGERSLTGCPGRGTPSWVRFARSHLIIRAGG